MKELLVIGHLVEIRGTADAPLAVFAQTNEEGDPLPACELVKIPLDNPSDARLLGAELYKNFAITIALCDGGES